MTRSGACPHLSLTAPPRPGSELCSFGYGMRKFSQAPLGRTQHNGLQWPRRSGSCLQGGLCARDGLLRCFELLCALSLASNAILPVHKTLAIH
jgi:hypothetical protein